MGRLNGRFVVAVGVVVAILVGFVVWNERREQPTAQRADSATTESVRADVGAEIDATVSIGAFTLSLSAGAVAGDGVVEVAHTKTPQDLPRFVEVVGEPVSVDLVDAQLTGVADLTFDLPAAVSDEQYVVIWQDAEGSWRWLPTEAVPGSTQATAQSDHFSVGFLSKIDVRKWAQDRWEDAYNYITSRADVAQPSCGDEQMIRDDGITVESDYGDSIKWCVGVENGRAVAKVANNRRTYTQISYPKTWELVDRGSMGISVDALIRSTTGKVESFLLSDEYDIRIVSGGDTLTFVLPNSLSGRVTAELSTTAWMATILKLGLEVWGGVAGAANSKLGQQASTTWERLLGAVDGDGSLKAWGGAVEGCLKSLTESVTDQPSNSPSFHEDASKLAKMAWGCVPEIAKADFAASGFTMFGAGVVIAAVNAIAGAVLSAMHLLLTGAREIWDTFASFGGNSDPIYDIVIRNAYNPIEVWTDRVGDIALGMPEDEAVRVGGLTNPGPDYCGQEIGGDPEARQYEKRLPDGTLVLVVFFEGVVSQFLVDGQWTFGGTNLRSGMTTDEAITALREAGWTADRFDDEIMDGPTIYAETRDHEIGVSLGDGDKIGRIGIPLGGCD